MVGNEEMTMADLIRLSKIDEFYRNLLENKTKEIFDRVYGDRYRLEITNLIYIPKEISEEELSEYTMGQTINIPDFEISLYLKK